MWLFVVGVLAFVIVRCSSRVVVRCWLSLHVDDCRCLFRVVCCLLLGVMCLLCVVCRVLVVVFWLSVVFVVCVLFVCFVRLVFVGCSFVAVCLSFVVCCCRWCVCRCVFVFGVCSSFVVVSR